MTFFTPMSTDIDMIVRILESEGRYLLMRWIQVASREHGGGGMDEARLANQEPFVRCRQVPTIDLVERPVVEGLTG